MRFRTTIPSSLVVGLILGVTACSSDPLGVNAGDQLSAAEIQSVLDAMSAAFAGGSTLNGPAAGSGPSFGPAAVPINQSFDFSAACQSGTVGLSGSVNGQLDDQTLEGSLSMELTWRLNSCLVATETTSFTVNHEPEITFTGDFDFTQDEISVSGTEKGGFRFTAADGRTGSCAIDLTFSTSFNAVAQSATNSVSGTICGLSADQFVPLDLSGTS